MGVQARFYVAKITKFAGASGYGEVTLQASTRGEENKTWASATPVGNITMTINNPSALDWFDEQRAAGRDLALVFDVAG